EDYTPSSLHRLFLLYGCLSHVVPLPPRSTLFPYTTLFRSRRILGDLRRQLHRGPGRPRACSKAACDVHRDDRSRWAPSSGLRGRSEEHTSELQSRENLVCRLLLEKKNREY